MKAHPRIRRFAKWAGTFVTLAFIAAWVASAWGSVGYDFARSGAGWMAGQFYVGWFPSTNTTSPSSKPGWHAQFGGYYFGFLRGFDYSDNVKGVPFVSIGVPGWFLALLAATPTTIAWRRHWLAYKLSLQGRCPHCTFDLSGLAPDAVCPECGESALSTRA